MQYDGNFNKFSTNFLYRDQTINHQSTTPSFGDAMYRFLKFLVSQIRLEISNKPTINIDTSCIDIPTTYCSFIVNSILLAI